MKNKKSSPHYDNELFMESIPPDKTFTLRNSRSSFTSNFEKDSNTCSQSSTEVSASSNDTNYTLEVYTTSHTCITIESVQSDSNNIIDRLPSTEAPFYHRNKSDMISSNYYVVNNPSLQKLHAQNQDSAKLNHFLLESLRETKHFF